jgi:hypothetical protein
MPYERESSLVFHHRFLGGALALRFWTKPHWKSPGQGQWADCDDTIPPKRPYRWATLSNEAIQLVCDFGWDISRRL